MAQLISIQIGKPKTYGTPHAADPNQRTWRSAIFKAPALGPLWLGEESLAGDAVANLEYHGGADNAALCYSAEHYPKWQREWGVPDPLPFGGFGENFTISGLDEHSACLGDVYAIGEARVQVSGPRKPCYKLERRLKRYDLVKRVTETNRGGWYVRVLQTGFVSAGDQIDLLQRPRPQWPIARICDVSYARDRREERLELLSVPELAGRWRAWLMNKLEATAASLA